MLDRESTFADPQIIKLLQTRFVPVAIDQAYQRRQKDAEGEFYRKIAGASPRNNFNGTTQGLYIATASGKFLAFSNHRSPDRIRRMIDKALEAFKPGAASAIDPGSPDQRFNPKLPEGGLVVRVRAKVLGGYEKTNDRWRKIFQAAVSRDNLWITPKEHQSLVRGEFSKSLQLRIARFHLIDNTRGEAPSWKPQAVRTLDLSLDQGRITGSVRLQTASGDRGYEAEVLGFVETTAGKISRLEIVVKGQFHGDAKYTRGAPKGKFPLAITLTLADGTDIADELPPHGSRGWVQGYLR